MAATEENKKPPIRGVNVFLLRVLFRLLMHMTSRITDEFLYQLRKRVYIFEKFFLFLAKTVPRGNTLIDGYSKDTLWEEMSPFGPISLLSLVSPGPISEIFSYQLKKLSTFDRI